MPPLLNVIAGELVEPASGKWSQRGTTPDGRLELDALPRSDARDVERALLAARAAAPEWASLTAFARADHLRAAASEMRARLESLATTICHEVGKPIAEARAEVDNAARVLDFYAGLAHAIGGDHFASARDGVHLFTRREPRGVVAIITPWNFPISLAIVKLAPALLCGNTAVWKPASPSATSSAALAACLSDAGIPAGVVNMVLGGGGSVGDPLTDAELGAISFTGSCEVGQSIERRSAARGVRTLTELGGKNVAIVCADADLDLAVEAVVGGAFRYAGQKCTATSRLVVVDAVHDEFVTRLTARVATLVVGVPDDPTAFVGPVISQECVDTTLKCIADAVAGGAQVVSGGSRADVAAAPDGTFLEPTVVVGVTPNMRLAREELFAPVLAVLSARDIEEAYAIADDTEFGLTAAIFTRDLSTAFEYVARADAGAVSVNLPTSGVEYQLSLGGRRNSGSGGQEQGLATLDFYTRSKSVSVRYAP